MIAVDDRRSDACRTWGDVGLYKFAENSHSLLVGIRVCRSYIDDPATLFGDDVVLAPRFDLRYLYAYRPEHFTFARKFE